MINVSVVIPTYNRSAAVADTLHSLAPEMDAIGAECIVVDQSEAQEATAVRDACSRYPMVKYVHVDRPSLPGARNIGARVARGEVIVFLDDDIIPDADLLKSHAAAYRDEDIGAVAGRIVEVRRGRNRNTSSLGTMFTWYGRILRNYDHQTPGFVEAPPGGNMSFRRAAMARTGDFDVKYEGNATLEETDYGFRVRRAGYRIAFAPDALVQHLAVPSGGCRLASEREVEISNLRNTLRFVRKYGPVAMRPLQLLVPVATFLRRSRRAGIPLGDAVAIAARTLRAPQNARESRTPITAA